MKEKQGTTDIMMDTFINPLMKLRLAYLRLIAESWRDDDLKNDIIHGKDIFTLLKDYGFHSPWKHLELVLVHDEHKKTEWHPSETSGWIGSDDTFIINIPKKPEDVEQHARALAAYYQLFPTLFGLSGEEKEEDHGFSGALPLDLGVDSAVFLEFGALTLRAIALAWGNQTFLDELATPMGAQPKDAKPALGRWLGYNAPWNFDIHFIIDPQFRWKSDQKKKHSQGHYTGIPKNSIVLHYPVKPEKEQFHAIALTSYNCTGPAYPFSCA